MSNANGEMSNEKGSVKAARYRADLRERLRRINVALPLSPFRERSAGFSLVEMLIVLALFVGILGLSVPFLRTFQTFQLLNDASEQITQDLRRAQTLAVAGVGTDGAGNRNHGVHFDISADQWTLFTGPTYVIGDPDNEAHTLSPAVDLASVALAGGGSSVIFTERAGRTTTTGTIVLQSSGRQATITVNAAGRVDRQ